MPWFLRSYGMFNREFLEKFRPVRSKSWAISAKILWIGSWVSMIDWCKGQMVERLSDVSSKTDQKCIFCVFRLFFVGFWYVDKLTLSQREGGGGRLCPPNDTGILGFSDLPTAMVIFQSHTGPYKCSLSGIKVSYESTFVCKEEVIGFNTYIIYVFHLL